MLSAIVVDEKDNVATALRDLAAGEEAATESGGHARQTRLVNPIPFGHKFALSEIAAGEPIIKYGEVIGMSTAVIAAGEHVHVHNVEGLRGRGDRK